MTSLIFRMAGTQVPVDRACSRRSNCRVIERAMPWGWIGRRALSLDVDDAAGTSVPRHHQPRGVDGAQDAVHRQGYITKRVLLNIASEATRRSRKFAVRGGIPAPQAEAGS